MKLSKHNLLIFLVLIVLRFANDLSLRIRSGAGTVTVANTSTCQGLYRDNDYVINQRRIHYEDLSKANAKEATSLLESDCKPSRWWSSTSATSSVMKSWTVRCMCCRLSTEQPGNIRALHVKGLWCVLNCNCDIWGIVAVALNLISGRRFDSFSTFDMLGMFWIKAEQ